MRGSYNIIYERDVSRVFHLVGEIVLQIIIIKVDTFDVQKIFVADK